MRYIDNLNEEVRKEIDIYWEDDSMETFYFD